MKQKIRCLLVHDREDRLLMLKSALHGIGVESTRARTCHLAGPILCDTPPPHLVFSDVVLPDGNWMDVLDLTAKAKERVNLIVVSPRADIGLYIDVMNHGAFDFITESFTVSEIVYVVQTGIENALNARLHAEGTPRRPGGRLGLEESKLGDEGAGRAHAWPS